MSRPELYLNNDLKDEDKNFSRLCSSAVTVAERELRPIVLFSDPLVVMLSESFRCIAFSDCRHLKK